MRKVYPDGRAALAGLLRDGMTIMAGGFGLCGIPENLIEAVRDSGVKDLTVISNNAGIDGLGLGILLETRQVKKMISSYVGENKNFERQYLAGELEVELTPQGTLAERIRAGGAGIPAFFTPTGVGTLVAEGKEMREFDGRRYVLERGLLADFAIVQAWKGDTDGNLVYRKTARNFNPMMATAAHGHDRRGRAAGRAGRARSRRRPPARHLRASASSTCPNVREAHRAAHRPQARTRAAAAAPARCDLEDDPCPGPATRWPRAPRRSCRTATTSTSASACRRWSRTTSRRASSVTLQSENGMLGIGPFPTRARRTRTSSTPASRPSPSCPATCYFCVADSFAMIRGGHIDLAILGRACRWPRGDLANWMIPGKMVKGMGGAMDLVAGVEARRSW